MSFRVDVESRGMGTAFDEFEAFTEARIQRALLRASSRGAGRLKALVRGQMQAAGLGRLGNAYDVRSDEQEGRGVHHDADGGFSASGMLYVRTRSERTRGALSAYTRGADIAPQRGRWLWFATDDIPRIASDRTRLTPANWTSSGMDKKIGPLVLIHSVNGFPLLVVKDASVSGEGKARRAKSLTKTGRVKKGQVAKQFIVAFIGIPRTSRAARVDINALHALVRSELPDLFAAEMRRA